MAPRTDFISPGETRILHEDDEHQVIWLSWEDEEKHADLVQTNQLLIIHGDRAVFLDPGGTYVFPHVMEAIQRHVPPGAITDIVATHQDPDVSSSVPLWLKATPAQLHISRVWLHFVAHFGLDDIQRVRPIPDGGDRLPLGNGGELVFIPAHFLHSVGNFHVYDPKARVLFTGDMGAALFPPGERPLFVLDFEHHKRYMEGFHRRYMHSRALCRDWAERVRPLGIDYLVPQHGAIFAGDDIPAFLDWIGDLECGGDRINAIREANGP